jgi:Flp pilus assembly protein TadB
LGETKKKLAFELSQLKVKLANKVVELNTERQRCHTSKRALHAQVIEAEQRRDDVVDTLRESSKKSNRLEKECEGILSSYMICFLLSFTSLFFICLTFSNWLDQPSVEISKSS